MSEKPSIGGVEVGYTVIQQGTKPWKLIPEAKRRKFHRGKNPSQLVFFELRP